MWKRTGFWSWLQRHFCSCNGDVKREIDLGFWPEFGASGKHHGDKLNAYVKAEKEPELNIYLTISQRMSINQDTLKSYKVERKNELALELKKTLLWPVASTKTLSWKAAKEIGVTEVRDSVLQTCVFTGSKLILIWSLRVLRRRSSRNGNWTIADQNVF